MLPVTTSGWVGFAVSCVLIYTLIGLATTIVIAYLNKVIYNDTFFYEGDWERAGALNFFLPPYVVAVLWPVVIPGIIIGFICMGLFNGTAKLACKARKAAEAHRKQQGDHRENPK